MIQFIFLFFSIFCFQAHSIKESQVLTQIIPLLQKSTHFYEMDYFESNKGGLKVQITDAQKNELKAKQSKLKIYFTKFGKQMGEKGSLVISPGRTETSLKYIEVAYDFIKQGYSPIYAIDHRGQGFSDRVLKNSHKAYVQNFSYYVHDFKYFIEHIVLKDQDVDKNNLFLLSHSLGGTIAIRYLQNNSNNPFKSAAFSSPLFRIKFSDSNEFMAHLKTFFVCTDLITKYISCNDYASDDKDFDWSKRIFKDNNGTYNDLTHSKSRFKLRDYIWGNWSNNNLTNTQANVLLGGVTIRWVNQVISANKLLRTESELNKVKTPVIILTADLDSVVEISDHIKVCNLLKNCRQYVLEASHHEVLMEKDKQRTLALNEIMNFFEKH